MPGHREPEIGRQFEDGFITLLKRLGYVIWRKRDTATGIDIVATFDGIPKYPENEEHYLCNLIRPLFSPEGIIAFSLKRGNPTKIDADELLTKIERSKNLEDIEAISIDRVKKSLERGVLATNYTKSISDIDQLLERNIYCWDIIRMLFYTNKSKLCYKLSLESNVYEQKFDCGVIGTYILSPLYFNNGTLFIQSSIFIEEYKPERMISADHLDTMLHEVYDKNLKPIISSKIITDIEMKSEIHILNLADSSLLDEAFIRYAGDVNRHPNVTWRRDFDIYSYESRPWYPFL